MRVHQENITIETRGRGLYDVTDRVRRVVSASGVATGLCTVFCRHTSASLIIQENADPAVLRDMERWIEKLAPEKDDYEHDAEGPDDMPSHLRTVMSRTSESIPIGGGKLVLGTWQGLYVWEHRVRRHARELVVHVAGVSLT